MKIGTKKIANMNALKRRCVYSKSLEEFCEKCDHFLADAVCQKVMRIRDDEVHNMSQIDSFNYDLEDTGTGVRPIRKEYKLSAVELRENYIYTMKKLVEIRNVVQKILDETNFWHVYYALEKAGEEIWIN